MTLLQVLIFGKINSHAMIRILNLLKMKFDFYSTVYTVLGRPCFVVSLWSS